MTGLTLCLAPAIDMQRKGLNARAIVAELDRIASECTQPAICAHRDAGCREVNARYLRDLHARKKVRAK